MRNQPDRSNNQCPRCRAEIAVASTGLFGLMRCPVCEANLWYAQGPESEWVFHFRQLNEQQAGCLRQLLADQLGIADLSSMQSFDWASIQALGADSLDTVELVMELEEELSSWDGADSDDSDEPPLSPA